MRRSEFSKGKHSFPFFVAALLAGCAENPKLESVAYGIGHHTFVSSTQVVVAVERTEFWSGHKQISGWNYPDLITTVRAYLVRSDSESQILRLQSGGWVGGTGNARAYEHVRPGFLLSPDAGFLYDVVKDSVQKLTFGGRLPREICAALKPACSFLSGLDVRSGPDSGTYLLTCREHCADGVRRRLSSYHLLREPDGVQRLEADSAGRPWLGVVALGGAIRGAFLLGDSAQVEIGPLTGAAPGESHVLRLHRRFLPGSELGFLRGQDAVWMEFAEGYIRAETQGGVGDWKHPLSQEEFAAVFDPMPTRLSYDASDLAYSIAFAADTGSTWRTYDFRPEFK